MGTRGFYCFRYKGLYYVIYNHWDSYPDGLGETLVNQLRNIDPQDLRNMIDNTIVVILDENVNKDQFPILSSDILEKFRKIIMQDSTYFVSIKQRYSEFQKTIVEDSSMFNEWINNAFDSQEDKWRFCFSELFSNRTLRIDKALSFGFFPAECAPDINPPENDLWIEWVYLIDLDNETFSAQDGKTFVKFGYHDIPKDWMIEFKENVDGENDDGSSW